MTTPELFRIDVHHHAQPPVLQEVLEKGGVLGNPDLGLNPETLIAIDEWDVDEHLSVMDHNGVATAILQDYGSANIVEDEYKHDVARSVNEFFAKVTRDHPDRFGAFASLPTPYGDAAVDEVRYALDELDLDGVVLGSSHEGTYLGDRAYDDLFAELNRRGAVVFVHPVPPLGRQLKLAQPVFLLEFPFDTARAVTNMILAGTFERFPDVRLIFAHGCGVMPYLHSRLAAARIALGQSSSMDECTSAMDAIYGHIYYDTAGVMSSTTLSMLDQVADRAHVLFGSDWPPSPVKLLELTIEGIENHPGFDEEQRRMIQRDNALALFPRLEGKTGR